MASLPVSAVCIAAAEYPNAAGVEFCFQYDKQSSWFKILHEFHYAHTEHARRGRIAFSGSQFSRQYSRLFGKPLAQDAERLQSSAMQAVQLRHRERLQVIIVFWPVNSKKSI